MNVELGNIVCATVQMVGNKSNGEGVAFAMDLSDMKESSGFITALVYNVFKFDDIRHFDFVESISLNPVYTFVNKIFEDKKNFIKQSNNIARYLYDQSLHPNIKNGELYIIFIQDSKINGVKTDAVLMLKSEKKDTFLTTNSEDGKINVKPIIGLSINQIDKGCLIFNLQKEEGYVVAVVDNTNSGKDAHYWTDSFLHVVPYNDDYHKTKLMVNFCTDFIRYMKKKVPEQDLESVKAIGHVAEVFKTENAVSLQQIEKIMSFTNESSNCLAEFKEIYEKSKEPLPLSSFHINMGERNRIGINRAYTLKIGKDFEVKILNPSADIEKGYDMEKKMNYYKLYSD